MAVARPSARAVEFDPADADPATETLEIATCDDGVDEDDDAADSDDETVELTLQDPTNAFVGVTEDTGTGHIGDNDLVAVSVGDGDPDDSDDDAEAAEGNPLVFQVSLDKPSDRQVLVDYYTHSGGGSLTATAGDDYVAVPRASAATLTFAPGERSKPVTVNTETDDEPESVERMQLRLANPRTDPTTDPAPPDAYLGNEIALCVIRDGCVDPGDAGAEVPALTADDDSIDVREGSAGAFTVTVGAPLCRDPHLYYRLAAGAPTAGRFDAVPLAGARTPGTARDSYTSWTFRIQTYDDDVHEGDETFTVEVAWDLLGFESPPPAGYEPLAAQFRSSAPLAVTVTIIDDDEAPLLSVSDGGPVGAGAPGPVEEGSPVEFVVSLDRPSALPVPFEYYTQSGGGSLTAQAGTDYTQVQPTAAAIAATATDATATLSGLRVTHSVQPGAQRLAVQTLQEDPPAAEGVERFQLRLQNWQNARQGDHIGTGEIRDACIDPDTDTASSPIPALTIQDASHDEGAGEQLVQVRLSAPLCRSVSVSYSMFGDHDDPGAHYAGPDDFRGSQGRGSAPAGALSFNLPARLAIVDDSLDEHDEAVPIWVRWDSGGADAAPARWAAAAREEGTVTIRDNDPLPRLRIADAVATGGTPLSFAVDLVDADDRPAISGRDVSVRYRTAPDPSAGTGAAQPGASCDGTADFVSVTGQPTLEIAAGTDTSAAPATITVATCANRPDPADKTLLLQLERSSAENAAIGDDTALGTIGTDCIDPFELTPGRYDNYIGSVLGNPGGSQFAQSSVGEGQQWIVIFRPNAYFCDQIDDAVQVTYSTDPSLIGWSRPATAEAADFDPPSAERTILSAPLGGGIIETQAALTITDDTEVEGPEQFYIDIRWGPGMPDSWRLPEFDNIDGVRWGFPVGISDDDYAEVSVADVTAPEDDTSLEFTLTLDRPSAEAATVGWSTASPLDAAVRAATPNVDYTAASGTAAFDAGTIQATVSVDLIDDERPEPDEAFRLVLSNPVGLQLGDDTDAAGTITDDDGGCVDIYDAAADPPGWSAAAGPVPGSAGAVYGSAAEGGLIRFGVVLDKPLCKNGWYTVEARTGTGTAGAGDYVLDAPLAAANWFPAAATLDVFAGRAVDDTVIEADETFELTVRWHADRMPSHYHDEDEQLALAGTIVDDDFPSASIADATAPESDGTLVFAITLDHPAAQAASVQYATDVRPSAGYRAAARDIDYTHTTGSVDFAAGDTTATVAVPIAFDGTSEPNETFLLKLSSPRSLNLADEEAVGTIRDLATVSLHDVRAGEGESTTMVWRLDRPAGADASFWVSVDTGEATTATVCAAGTVTDCDGSFLSCGRFVLLPDTDTTSAGCVAAAYDDDLYEGDEQVAYRLTEVTGLWLGDVEAVLTITDGETAPQLSAGADLADTEGRTLTFTITLTGPARERDATVVYATEDDTATSGRVCTVAGPDYVTAGGTLTFAPGTNTRTVTVTTCPNADDDGDREFVLRLTAATGAVIADGGDSARGRIEDDDDESDYCIDPENSPPQQLSFDAHEEEWEDAAALRFKPQFSGKYCDGVRLQIAYRTADGTAAAPDDYTSVSGSVDFDPNALWELQPIWWRPLHIGVSIHVDTLAEDDETLLFFVRWGDDMPASWRALLEVETYAIILDDD